MSLKYYPGYLVCEHIWQKDDKTIGWERCSCGDDKKEGEVVPYGL